MESQYKTGNNGGIETGANYTTNGRGSEVAVANKKSFRGWDFVLRLLALALSLAAAVVLGVNKQTTTMPVSLVPSLPPVNVPVTAKFHYLSAFTYLVVANAIAGGYAVISLLLALANRRGNKAISLLTMILDLAMVALLFSAIGASLAVGLIGYKGNSHVRWDKVCNVFGRFCHQVAASVALTAASAGAFFLLVILIVFNLHKRH
ncbi:CASP-like protein 5-like [Dorcoceras hygrometricum]|uniref:CASP-like protein n=1 Tax=Dorcoceras hygrometricum TaxID=472368 RepID=A0A2Z7ALG3_9LAMI|nr:CASP-like protein 5-like [Dorcoceras hygrometricum]